MNQPLEFQGKDVKSAIKKALFKLQLQKDDVDIEVIHSGADRPFMLGRSKAKIIVSKREDASSPATLDTNWEDWLKNEIQENSSNINIPKTSFPPSNLNGKAWIKDGSLYFKDTETNKPIISPATGITIKKNGSVIKEKTCLIKGDDISFELENKSFETKWSIKVNHKKQLVRLTVEPGYFIVSYLEDQPPIENLTPHICTRKQANNQLVEEDVYEQLTKMKITEGIKPEQITKACSCIEAESFIIAEGTQPINGENGEVKFSIDIKENHRAFSEKVDGTIDFRESIYIPSIEEGAQLGEVTDPTAGIDGMSVFGETLKSKNGEPIVIKTGKGITFLEDEKKLIALEKGRPKVEKIGQLVRVSILPKLVHRGDLNMKDGNIHFVGDVEVVGHVNEHMTVDAEGSASIHRSVLHSSIQTRNSIIINGNSIKSTLTAGKNSLVFEEMVEKLSGFLTHFQPFCHAIQQIVQSQQFQKAYQIENGLGPVIRVLMESKYKELLLSSNQLIRIINEKQGLLGRRWQAFAVRIYKGLLVYHHNEFKTFEDLEDFHSDALELMDICQSPVSTDSVISVNYAMNSIINCNGDVYIKGKGCVQTTINADGIVTVKGKVIGGRIYAKGDVHLEHAGSLSGVKTIIEVPFDKIIEISKVYPDVVIKIGHKQHMFTKEQTQIKAYVNKQDQLLLY